ncbi:MAG TPA: hypothetical protein ENI06_04225 [Spirochaetales bacterium]|nr:hypothetical protein [Spirochaetales bacterium]
MLWVELPQNIDSLSLFGAALEQEVAFAPGPLFSRQGKYNNFIRVSAGVLNDQVISAIVRLGGMVRREVGVIKDNDLIQP